MYFLVSGSIGPLWEDQVSNLTPSGLWTLYQNFYIPIILYRGTLYRGALWKISYGENILMLAESIQGQAKPLYTRPLYTFTRNRRNPIFTYLVSTSKPKIYIFGVEHEAWPTLDQVQNSKIYRAKPAMTGLTARLTLSDTKPLDTMHSRQSLIYRGLQPFLGHTLSTGTIYPAQSPSTSLQLPLIKSP